MRSGRNYHMTPVLRELHGLPFEIHVNYKVHMYTYKAMQDMAPSYLTCLLIKSKPLQLHAQVQKCCLWCPKLP